jgi:hypothetical protein
MDALTDFLNDPLVIPIVSLLIVAALNFLFAVYRSWQQGQFDWEKLPRLLDTLVVKKVFPLAILGAASFFVTEDAAQTGLVVAYITAAAAALAAEVASLIYKAQNTYTASLKDGTERYQPSPDGGPSDDTP